jgi:hypothetical protein
MRFHLHPFALQPTSKVTVEQLGAGIEVDGCNRGVPMNEVRALVVLVAVDVVAVAVAVVDATVVVKDVTVVVVDVEVAVVLVIVTVSGIEVLALVVLVAVEVVVDAVVVVDVTVVVKDVTVAVVEVEVAVVLVPVAVVRVAVAVVVMDDWVVEVNVDVVVMTRLRTCAIQSSFLVDGGSPKFTDTPPATVLTEPVSSPPPVRGLYHRTSKIPGAPLRSRFRAATRPPMFRGNEMAYTNPCSARHQ